jgi:ketosteroid isomerase-like protein
MQSPYDQINEHLHRWAEDPAGCMMKVTPDVVYRLNVSRDLLPLGGETVGWDAVNSVMLGIREVFDYLVYNPRILSVADNVVRARIELMLRHKPSGEILTGQMRSVFTVRDGLIARVDEYVDAPMVESFMRLVGAGRPPQGEP